jgi:hypothetical protein
MLKKALTVAAIAACLTSSAEAKNIRFSSGWVNRDGAIVVGTGFSVTHDATGEYTITYPAGSFKKPPVFSCIPAGINGSLAVCDLFTYVGNSGGIAVQFRLFTRSSGAAQDNDFQFTEVTTR